MADAFSLAAVLHLRQHKEDMEERALLSLAAHQQQVEATLGRVRRQTVLWAEDRNREVGCVGSGNTQQGSYGKLALLREAEKQLLEQLVDLQKRITEQQIAYLNARRAREVLSNLKETHEADERFARERREQRRLEDLLLGRWLVKDRATRQTLGKSCRAE